MAETQQPVIVVDTGTPTFGMRLKSIREARGLEPQDVAKQLRLSKEIIYMLESESYPDTLPITFIRGYVRAYGKFLDIPEQEIKLALEPIKPKEIIPPQDSITKNSTVNHLKYVMQLITAIIALTIIGLMGMWWHAHNDSEVQQSTIIAENFNDNNIKEIVNHSNNDDDVAKDVANIINQEANEKNILNPNDSAALAKTLKEPSIHVDKIYPAIKKSRLFSLIIGNHHSIMQFATHFIIFMMIGLISLCWYHYKIISKLRYSFKDASTINSNTCDNAVATLSIKKIRIYLALILFMLVSLFCVWWYNLLVSLNSNLSKQNIALQPAGNANNIIIPFKSSSVEDNPVSINNQQPTNNQSDDVQKINGPIITPPFIQSAVVKPNVNGKLHVNSMKKIALTFSKKYTPIPVAEELDSSEELNPAIVTNREDKPAMQPFSDEN